MNTINYMERFRLDKKVSVVCGGLGLIGKEVSIALAQAGSKVIVLDFDKEKGKKFEQQCKKDKLDIEFIDFNVKDMDSYDGMVAGIFKKHRHLDVFVNASYPRTKDYGEKLENVKIASWQENIDSHLNSFCLLTRSAAELMKKEKIKGSIINFGSIYGVVAPDFGIYEGTDMTNPGEYAAIKGGIIAFTKYAASYYGKYGIRANSLCPGGVFDKQNPIFLKNYNKKTSLGRMANAYEVASAALFLSSEASSYITGAVIMVDGGWTAI